MNLLYYTSFKPTQVWPREGKKPEVQNTVEHKLNRKISINFTKYTAYSKCEYGEIGVKNCLSTILFIVEI